jgi:hypothetical protein
LENPLDTSWFDLKKYEKLKELDLQGWATQLEIRRNMLTFKVLAEIYVNKIKENPIFIYSDDTDSDIKTFSFKLPPSLSVKSKNKNQELHEGNEKYIGWLEMTDNEMDEFIKGGNERYIEDTGYLIRGVSSEVVVDLTATDEQIINDFRQWLTDYRKSIGYTPIKKSFTEKHLFEWTQWRLLPYLDLKIVSCIEGKELKLSRVARLLFEDEYEIDIVDRLRRTTKPKAEWLIKDETIDAILTQVRSMA